MSSMTPFFSITASSSFFTSSKVKPYWKPEQPPPVTNTRSLSSGLPSSSISCLTLFAALSLNTSGEGTSVTAFISSLLDPFQLIGPRRPQPNPFCRRQRGPPPAPQPPPPGGFRALVIPLPLGPPPPP